MIYGIIFVFSGYLLFLSIILFLSVYAYNNSTLFEFSVNAFLTATKFFLDILKPVSGFVSDAIDEVKNAPADTVKLFCEVFNVIWKFYLANKRFIRADINISFK